MATIKFLGKSGKPGLSECMKRKWVALDKETKLISRTKEAVLSHILHQIHLPQLVVPKSILCYILEVSTRLQ